MPHRIGFVPELATVVVRFWGDIKLEEIEAAMNEVPAQPWFRPHLKLIADLRDCTTAMTGMEVQSLAGYAKRVDPTWGETKWALLATNDLIYGLARMYMALTSEYQIETHVFRTSLESDDWLGLGMTIGEVLARAA